MLSLKITNLQKKKKLLICFTRIILSGFLCKLTLKDSKKYNYSLAYMKSRAAETTGWDS